MDFLIQSAYAQGAAPQGGGFSPILIMVVFIALMYFMMIRPQQKRQKEHTNLVSNLKTGDEILTSGGILGIITGISDHYAIVKIADNTEIKIQKSSVASVVPKDTFENA
jgi:preprotein translocase subunit YajC